MERANGQQTGTTYLWTITAGSSKATIVGSNTGTSALLQGTARSGAYFDVTVRLRYSWDGQPSTSDQTFTVHQASRSTVSGPQASTRVSQADQSSHVAGAWTWKRAVLYTVRSQLYLPLPGCILWDEDWTMEADSWLPVGAHGGRHTDGNAQVTDAQGGPGGYSLTDAQVAGLPAGKSVFHGDQDVSVDGSDDFWDNSVLYNLPGVQVTFNN